MWSVYHRNFGNEFLPFKRQTLSNFTILSARHDVKLNIFPFSFPTWLKSTNYNSLSASKREISLKIVEAWVVMFNSFNDFFSWRMASLEIYFNSFRNIQSSRIKRVRVLRNLRSS